MSNYLFEKSFRQGPPSAPASSFFVQHQWGFCGEFGVFVPTLPHQSVNGSSISRQIATVLIVLLVLIVALNFESKSKGSEFIFILYSYVFKGPKKRHNLNKVPENRSNWHFCFDYSLQSPQYRPPHRQSTLQQFGLKNSAQLLVMAMMNFLKIFLQNKSSNLKI